MPRKKDPKNQPKLNFSPYLLSDIGPERAANPSYGIVNSSNTISTVEHLYISSGNTPPATSTALWPKSPLRLVVARAPHVDLDEERDTAALTKFLDTLECGHQVWVHVFKHYDDNWKYVDMLPTQKRHRCQECKGLANAKKKPESAKTKKRRAA